MHFWQLPATGPWQVFVVSHTWKKLKRFKLIIYPGSCTCFLLAFYLQLCLSSFNFKFFNYQKLEYFTEQIKSGIWKQALSVTSSLLHSTFFSTFCLTSVLLCCEWLSAQCQSSQLACCEGEAAYLGLAFDSVVISPVLLLRPRLCCSYCQGRRYYLSYFDGSDFSLTMFLTVPKPRPACHRVSELIIHSISICSELSGSIIPKT